MEHPTVKQRDHIHVRIPVSVSKRDVKSFQYRRRFDVCYDSECLLKMSYAEKQDVCSEWEKRTSLTVSRYHPQKSIVVS